MQELRKVLKLDKTSFYETHLSLINCILPIRMTPMEVKVMAGFMALEGDIAIYRFGPSAKKIIMKELKLSPAGLSNYITSLIEKGFLIRTGDMINILPLLIPERDEQQYLFKLINTGDTNGTTTTVTQDREQELRDSDREHSPEGNGSIRVQNILSGEG